MIGRQHGRFTHVLVFTAVGLAAAGCSQSGDELPREPVSGTVTLDSQPLADGVIQFMPATSATGEGTAVIQPGGATIKGGRFSIPRDTGLVPGSYNVAINAADRGAEQTKPDVPGTGQKAQKGRVPKELIPAKYNAQTELKAEIKKGGASDLKFDLQSQK
jgi:hypothetical protein